MKIYLVIKYHADQRNRDAIEAITAVLGLRGHETHWVVRDVEQWGALSLPADELMQHAFAAILAADVVLVDLAEKGVGVGIEAGYAHANGIPVVTIAPVGADIFATLQGISTQCFFYTDYAELAQIALPLVTRPNQVLVYWRFITSSVDRLFACLADLNTTELNWRPLPNANSLAVLATHITGNIEETVLGLICGQPRTRDREAEFRVTETDRAALQHRWQIVQAEIAQQLAQLPPSDLARPRLHPRRGQLTGWEILLVVARHAAEHLAHAELTRDLLLAQRAIPSTSSSSFITHSP